LAKGFQKRGWISSVVPGGMDGLALGLQKYRMGSRRIEWFSYRVPEG